MAKKKLITNSDGTLSYPHNFKLGDLVEITEGYHFKNAYGNGIGIITNIDNENLKVYWQGADKYMNYTVASAFMTLKVISNE
jgi:hypothetical protein